MVKYETKDVEKGASDEVMDKGAARKTVSDKAEEPESDKPWNELSCCEQLKSVLWVVALIVILLGSLFFFICSLGLLEDSFQLLGDKTAGKIFQNNELLSNPIAGLMIGVLATVLVQSSSTSTSIIITMVGSDLIPIRFAVPIIMGANTGTSVTNTLVSLAQVSDRNEFKRAFAGATVHDMFNWMSVLILLPLEVALHYLERLTGEIVDSMHLQTHGKAPDMLKAITKPLTTLVVEVDKDVIKKTASMSNSSTSDDSVLKRWCGITDEVVNVTHHNHLIDVTVNCQQILTSPTSAAPSLLQMCQHVSKHNCLNLLNVSVTINFDSVDEVMQEKKIARCENLFAQSDLSDSAAGGILLVCSLIIIFLTLYGLVKILHSVLQGHLAKVIKKFINADLPGKAAYFTGYIFILVGCGMTMILQSSSIFTSTLTPMVGVGVVTVERMYPLTLGANIGTTLTGILAALSQEGDHVKKSLQIAFCHLFFNISGIILFYPLPFLRFPIDMAKSLGRTTSEHRWFAIAYLLILFILFPGAVFGLSLAGWIYLGAVGGPLLFFFLVILLINVIQRKKPQWLPLPLRNWNFLPLCLHSLKPIDNLIFKVCRCGFCRKLQEADQEDIHSENEVVVRVEVVQNHVSSPQAATTDIVSNGKAKQIYENGAFEKDEHRL